MSITVTITNKHCAVEGTPVIVCGNSDYTITFAFDAEWDQVSEKTARFSYIRRGQRLYHDVQFTGDTVTVPAVYGARELLVGVYSGDLVTTTSARIPCEKSIICEGGVPGDMPPTQYTQLLAEMDNRVSALCPDFTASGSLVTCEPFAGLMLDVAASEAATQIVRCGKNLFDFQKGVALITYTLSDGSVAEKYGYDIHLPAGTYTMKAYGTHTTSYIYGLVTDGNGNTKKSCSLVVGTSYTKQTVTIEDGDIIKIYNGVSIATTSISGSNLMFSRFDIQIEAGNTATDFEPYHGDTFAVGEPIPALAGVNYLYADAGEITVSGNADPVAIIEKLTVAIIAMGGTV